MCKASLFLLHAAAFSALAFSTCYIYLNETNRLGKVKRQCYNKIMDIKDDLIKRK